MKMVNACARIKRSNESQYVACRPVFVTVSPDTDSPKHLRDFQNIFDPTANLLVLRDESNKSPNLQKMLRSYKVPIDFTPDEIEKINKYFDKMHKKEKKWYQVWKRKQSYTQAYDTKHSRVIYLMGRDNKFLHFFDIDVTPDALYESVVDEISYDVGI